MMLMSVVRVIVAIITFLPFGAFGQEGEKCLREVLEQHRHREAKAQLPGRVSLFITDMEGLFDPGKARVDCQYADPSRIPGPIAPTSLLRATLDLTLCFQQAATAAFTERGDGRYFSLPRETCRIAMPREIEAGWYLSASCAARR